MDIPSISGYIVDPANWQQQQSNYQIGSSTGSNPAQQQQQPLPQLQAAPPNGIGITGSAIRPGSMADRARMENIPMPAAALKCPRCESTNTKFCYFNNYSLTQPRHFCKSCRRYWTRGGALRNVPVGGGCRKNKKSKASSSSIRSKSPAAHAASSSSTPLGSTTIVSPNSTVISANILSGLNPQIPPFRFMDSLSHNLTDDYSSRSDQISLSYGGILPAPAPVNDDTNEMNFQMGSNFLGSDGFVGASGIGNISSAGGIQQWRQHQAQQFPNSLDGSYLTSAGLFNPLQTSIKPSGYAGESSNQVRAKLSTSMLTNLTSVKVEDRQENASMNFLRINPGGDQQWSTGSSWTGLANFSTPSTSNPM